MAEKGILFNTEMVRAILEGRKTVTRRVIKPQHLRVLNSPYHQTHPDVPDKTLLERLCHPPYNVGDILYVRETYNLNNIYEEGDIYKLGFIYKASENEPDGGFRWVEVSEAIYDKYVETIAESNHHLWRPSIHMPKEAARIWLRVTDVRVERLWDMTTDDAIKEGVQWQDAVPCVPSVDYPPYVDADAVVKYQQEMEGKKMLRKSFGELWDSTINEKDLPRYGWNANPWVWVIEFERVEKTQ